MTRTSPKTSRLTLAIAASALLGLAGAAVAAERSPGQYLASPIYGKGALSAPGTGLPAAAATVDASAWKTNPSRFLPSPLYGAGLAWSGAEETPAAR